MKSRTDKNDRYAAIYGWTCAVLTVTAIVNTISGQPWYLICLNILAVICFAMAAIGSAQESRAKSPHKVPTPQQVKGDEPNSVPAPNTKEGEYEKYPFE